jgi:hypothetical protein
MHAPGAPAAPKLPPRLTSWRHQHVSGVHGPACAAPPQAASIAFIAACANSKQACPHFAAGKPWCAGAAPAAAQGAHAVTSPAQHRCRGLSLPLWLVVGLPLLLVAATHPRRAWQLQLQRHRCTRHRHSQPGTRRLPAPQAPWAAPAPCCTLLFHHSPPQQPTPYTPPRQLLLRAAAWPCQPPAWAGPCSVPPVARTPCTPPATTPAQARSVPQARWHRICVDLHATPSAPPPTHTQPQPTTPRLVTARHSCSHSTAAPSLAPGCCCPTHPSWEAARLGCNAQHAVQAAQPHPAPGR